MHATVFYYTTTNAHYVVHKQDRDNVHMVHLLLNQKIIFQLCRLNIFHTWQFNFRCKVETHVTSSHQKTQKSAFNFKQTFKKAKHKFKCRRTLKLQNVVICNQKCHGFF